MKLLYDDIKIKKNILFKSGSLIIADNGINLITGKNGIGKTSLLKNIFNKYHDIALFIDQDNEEIIPSISILENIAMSSSSEKISRAFEFLKQLELTYLLELNVKKLSGGEKRIISIIRGLLSDRSLIIMDEPTNDLDYILVEKLIKIICDNKNKKTFLIISHDERMHKISDIIFHIDMNGIATAEHIIGDYEVAQPQFNINKPKEDCTILQKVFNINYFPLLVAVCMVIFSAFTINNIAQARMETIPLMEKGQVEIFSPLSTKISVNNSGAYPISVMALLSENNKELFNSSKVIQEKLIEVNNMPITFGLNLNFSENYDIYPTEYYDPTNREYFYTLEECIEKVLNLDKNRFYIDSSKVFFDNNVDNENKVQLEFNTEDFYEAVDILNCTKNEQGKELEKLCLVIKLKNTYSFFDLLNNREFIELQYGNYYIRSNETITLTNQIETFNVHKKSLSVILVSSIIFIFILSIYTFTYCLISSKKISVLKNYGFSKESITNTLLTKFLNKKIRYLIFGTIILSNIIMFNCNNMIYELSYHLIYIIYILAFCLANFIGKTIIKLRIKQIYRWDYR